MIAPDGEWTSTRSYRDGSLVLETVFETETGSVAVIDFMPVNNPVPSVVRIVEGRAGQVAMKTEGVIRFDYGHSIPWVTRLPNDAGIVAIAGPSLVALHTAVRLEGEHMATVGHFSVAAGQRVAFTLSYGPSHLPAPEAFDVEAALTRTDLFWTEWSSLCAYDGPHREIVLRSMLTLKGLTFAANRRHRGGRDDVAAGTARWRAELGLPVLLAAQTRR